MRAILSVLGLVAIVLVVLIALGMLNVQVGNGSLPTISFSGGKAPDVKAEMGKVGLGTENHTIELPTVEMKNTTIQLPTVEVQQAGNNSAAGN